VCTAYSAAGPDSHYHRSRPLILETEDPFVALYVRLLATTGGTDIEVEVSEAERPFALPHLDVEPARGRQLVMPLDRADALRHILASLVRAGRGAAPSVRSAGMTPR
jgi:hypothetical protein